MEEQIEKLFRGENRNLAFAVIHIVDELKPYWPLTVRQVYYQCVSHGLLNNKHSSYTRISKMLTKLRRNDLVTWQAIEDRSRRTTDKRGVEDIEAFVAGQLEYFLDWRYYHRCRVQEQNIYLEVVTEKDALAGIMEDIVWPYCCRLNVGKGQVSASMVEQIAKRYDQAIMQGKEPVLLYFGDLDPSGVAIPKALKRNLYDWHSVDVKLIRCGLNPEQLQQYNLPISVDAAKKQDPNYQAWISNQEYTGIKPTELDAMHPKQLRELLKHSIESVLDMSSYKEQMQKEEIERDKLKVMRSEIINFMFEQHPHMMKNINYS